MRQRRIKASRAPSARSIANAVLAERVEQIHKESHHTYGRPRIKAELAAQGVGVGNDRIARLMKSLGIRGLSKRKSFTVTTTRAPENPRVPDLVNRNFVADGPNQLWVADMTYVPTWAGFIRRLTRTVDNLKIETSAAFGVSAMRKSKFSESQIMAILGEGEAGLPVAEVCRKHGISNATYYQWRSKYAGMSVNELKRVKDLEAENSRLKKMYAELALENAAIKDVLSRKL